MDEDKKVLFPEHAKLYTINPLTQAVGDFLVWLEENGMVICVRNQNDDKQSSFTLIDKDINQLISEHFKIDVAKLESEKLQMMKELDSMRKKVTDG